MITVGSIVTPRVPVKAGYTEGPIPADTVYLGEEPDALIYNRAITPGERFEVISIEGNNIAVINPIIGGEDLTVSCSDIEPWT